MQVGDVVKMRVGYSAPGVVAKLIDFHQEAQGFRHYAKVLWSDHGMGLEKRRDLRVISSVEDNYNKGGSHS